MTHGSLFSGIGGFDCAAQWMGWQNVFHCEWNPFGQRVLKYHFPESISYNDITKTNFSIHRGHIDVLSGGFPCQPYSSAGKRLGKEDDRHLWPEMLRAIREVQPRWVVGENVRGIISWSEGLVFDEVHSDLESEGYSVRAFVLPAAGVGAPHKRDRVFFIARKHASNSFGIRLEHGKEAGDIREGTGETQAEGSESAEPTKANGSNGDAADTNGKMLERRNRQGEAGWTAEQKIGTEPSDSAGAVEGHASNADRDGLERSIPSDINRQISGKKKHDAECLSTHERTIQFKNFPTKSPVCGGDDGLPRELDGITFSKWRKESIKAYGNAVVPQVILPIFRSIQQFESL